MVQSSGRSSPATRKKHTTGKDSYADPIGRELVGIGVLPRHTQQALQTAGLESKHPAEWKDEDSRKFAEKVREISKPTVIIANKMDLPYAEQNFERLRDEFKNQLVIPVCSEAELALKRAEEKGFIEYVPARNRSKSRRSPELQRIKHGP